MKSRPTAGTSGTSSRLTNGRRSIVVNPLHPNKKPPGKAVKREKGAKSMLVSPEQPRRKAGGSSVT